MLLISLLIFLSKIKKKKEQDINQNNIQKIQALSEAWDIQINNKTINYHLIDILDPHEDYSVFQFKNDFYPWFEPSTAPQNAEQLPKFFKREIIKNKLEKLKIKYIINITGETTTNSSSGALSCAAGPGGGGCFGFAWWDDTSSYSASVWDLNEATVIGNVSASVTGTSVIPAIVIPIPILARTQSNACEGLSNQILGFFS